MNIHLLLDNDPSSLVDIVDLTEFFRKLGSKQEPSYQWGSIMVACDPSTPIPFNTIASAFLPNVGAPRPKLEVIEVDRGLQEQITTYAELDGDDSIWNFYQITNSSPNLRELTIIGYQLAVGTCDEVPGFTLFPFLALRELFLDGVHWTTPRLLALFALPALESVAIRTSSPMPTTTGDFEWSEDAVNLPPLKIALVFGDFSDAALASVLRGTLGLRHLALSHPPPLMNSVASAPLPPEACPNLATLAIRNHASMPVAKTRDQWPRLQRLILNDGDEAGKIEEPGDDSFDIQRMPLEAMDMRSILEYMKRL